MERSVDRDKISLHIKVHTSGGKSGMIWVNQKDETWKMNQVRCTERTALLSFVVNYTHNWHTLGPKGGPMPMS
jgi:hypothetical protein